MSSSDGTGAVRRTVAEEPQIAAPSAARDGDGYDGQTDPWFEPGPKTAGDGDEQTEWFLPTGRAGLLPDSMTESWDEEDGIPADHVGRAEAVGAPPWGRDGASAAAGEPPPWENGPWPGPGGAATQRPGPSASESAAAEPAAAEPAARELDSGSERRQRSRLIVVGGAATIAIIVAIVVIVVATSGGPAAGCATYPAPVRSAYARAMSDLSNHAPPAVQAADLQRAVTLANASAAAASQISARTALFAMASDLDEAYSAVTKHRLVTSDLQQRLTADGTALPRSCPA